MTPRRALSLLVLAAAGVLLAGQVRQLLADPTVWPPDDFVEYWAAAKLTLVGENPFDGEKLLPLQRHAGRATDDAIMMWNPPWALPAVLPLGLLSAREAQLLWLLVHLAVTGFCADRLWLLLGGSRDRRWVGWAVAFAFMPTVFALSSGQISPFLLLGAVLFLECERRGWQYLAGAATVLLAIKPHLAYLVWVAVAADALARGRWRVLVGGAVAGLACALLPLMFNHLVWHQYADAMANRPPAQWLSPTLGTVLRLAFGAEHFRLQFVSVALGLGWFAWHRRRAGHNWSWTEQLPLLLAVSFATAPYGAWPFDMVLLLPLVFAMVVRPTPPTLLPAGRGENDARRTASVNERVGGAPAPLPSRFATSFSPLPAGRGAGEVGLFLVNLGCLVMNLFQLGSFWFLWVSPAVLLVCALHTSKQQGADAPRSPTAVPA